MHLVVDEQKSLFVTGILRSHDLQWRDITNDLRCDAMQRGQEVKSVSLVPLCPPLSSRVRYMQQHQKTGTILRQNIRAHKTSKK